MSADPKNAHVRKGRGDPRDLQAERAGKLLDDETFNTTFDDVRTSVIACIEEHKADGSQASEEYELELCRTLRTLRSVKRALILKAQGATLRAANFRPQPAETED